MTLSYGRTAALVSRAVLRAHPPRLRGLRVLCFHGVLPHARWASVPRTGAVTADAFEDAILGAVGRDGRVVTLPEALAADDDRLRILLTFDDGLASFVEHAQPVLQRRGWPAVLYVCTDYLDAGRWPDYPPDGERPLRHADLAALDSAVVTLGSHAHAHADLTAMPAAERTAALRRSLDALAATGLPYEPSLAYPFSAVDDGVRQSAAAAGFTSAVTALPGVTRRTEPVPGLVELSRVVARGPDEEMRVRVQGGYDWLGRLRTLVKG